MKLGRLMLLVVFLSSGGCSFFYYGAQTIVSDPYDALQECAFRMRMRRLAHLAWRNICKEDRKSYSAAYVKGFEDGFVDFVDANGNGEPPAIAPPHLRRQLLHSEAGQAEIENWFAGFRHGVQVARASGLREKYVMPIALPAKPPQDPVPARVIVPTNASLPAKTAPRTLPVQYIVPVPATAPVRNPAVLGPPL